MKRLRHVAGILVLAAVVVLVLERIAFKHGHPLVHRMSVDDRKALYEQVATFSGVLLGFIIAALSILVSLDPARPIVEELRRGASFSLLVINMLATVLGLFILTVMSISGRVFDDAVRGASGFETVYEIVLVFAALEFALAGFLFGVVTYKAGSYK